MPALPQVLKVKEAHYARLTEAGISAFPEADGLIRSAKALGLPLGVGSSGAPAKIERNLTLSVRSAIPTACMADGGGFIQSSACI